MTNAAPAKKKGLSTLAWVAIGCAGLVVVGAIAIFGLGWFAVQKGKEVVAEASGSDSFSDMMSDFRENPAKKMAEVVIAANPDLEIVSTDDEAGTITFHNSKTGETATLDFEDIAEGRFSVTTDEGEYKWDASEGEQGGVTLTGPDGETRIGGSATTSDVPGWAPMYPGAESIQSTYHTVTSESVSGIVVGKTSDGAQAVLDHYKKLFEDGGWKVGSQSLTTTPDGAFGSIVGERDGRTVTVTLGEQNGECQISVAYSGKA